MAKERLRKDKIEIAFRHNNMSLFEVWKNAANLNEVEAEILYQKKFSEECPTEEQIMEIIQQKFNYYCSDRAFRKLWHKVFKKIEKIIP